MIDWLIAIHATDVSLTDGYRLERNLAGFDDSLNMGNKTVKGTKDDSQVIYFWCLDNIKNTAREG
jgi:hypothetical protein